MNYKAAMLFGFSFVGLTLAGITFLYFLEYPQVQTEIIRIATGILTHPYFIIGTWIIVTIGHNLWVKYTPPGC